MFRTIFQRMTLRLRGHVLADTDAVPASTSDVSALYDDFAASLSSESNSFSDAKRVALLRDKGRFQKVVAKGANLHELMIAKPSESNQSDFTVVQDLETWGYTKYDSTDHVQRQGISQVLETIGVTAKFADNTLVSQTHKNPVIVEGVLYPETYALLCQVINPSDGVIVAYDNITAHALAGESGIELNLTRVPKLNFWSDVAYLQWLSKAEECSNLRYVLRYGVINDIARFIIEFLGLQSGLVVTEWPGKTYCAGSAKFNALLGSPNGAGVAHLLIQHKKQLGNKTVENITVFKRNCNIMFLFYITDVEVADNSDAGNEAAFVDVERKEDVVSLLGGI